MLGQIFRRTNGTSQNGRSGSMRRMAGGGLFGGRRRAASRTLGRTWAGHLETLEPRVVLAGDLLISEVLASNDTVLNDEDRESSDWVEVLNVSNSAVDLEGWSLTDDETDLRKWDFPSVDLPAGDSLIVFASGKDRAIAGSELHTNFRLSTRGEFLAIVQPDGAISDEYTPFPEQFTDVSYGPQQEVRPTELVAPGASARVLLPASAAQDVAASQWTSVGFNDAGWQAANLGIGFDADPLDGDFSTVINAQGDVSSMQGSTSSAYMRTEFQLPGTVPEYNTLTLGMNYDDGFVAYLNGTEIERVRAPETLAWNSTSTEQHGGVLEQRDYASFLDTDDQEEFMLSGDAKWLFGRLQLTGNQADQTSAAWTHQAIPFGTDYSFTTSMVIDVYSRGGSGGEGMTFVLQSGGNTRLGLGGDNLGLVDANMNFVAIEIDAQDDGGAFDDDKREEPHIGIITSSAGNVGRVEVERYNTGRVGENLRHLWVDYNGVTDQMDVYFSDTATRPDAPTLSATVDLEEVFSGVPELWAGWTATTTANINSHDVLSWSFTAGAGELGLVPVDFDVSEHASLLQPGTNVLAIHGLNAAADEEDFLVAPTLTATETLLTERMYFSAPTPGDTNGLGGLPPAGTVEFSVNTQVFVDAFNVTISAATPGATIRYTTDGSIPDVTSELYTGPIDVTESTRLRARAFEPNRDPGPISSEGYIQLDDSLVNFENGQPFESNMPLMVFESYQGRADNNDRFLVPVTGVFIAPGEDGRASIMDEPEFADRAGLRIRGQSSQGWPKKQYALETWEEGNDDSERIAAGDAADKSVSIFGLPRESDWVLNGPYSDKTQLNNYLTFLWSNEMGLYAPRTQLVEVFVNDNGGAVDFRTDYRGTYVLMEKIKRDRNRVDITELSPNENSEPEITGGYIWKKDKSGFNDKIFTTDSRQQLRMVEPDPTDVTDEQVEWLTNHVNEFEAALYGPDFADPDLGYAAYIDVGSWIDTWLLVEMTKQIDGYRLSTYYYKDRGGLIKQGPPWDYNLSLGNANYLRGAYTDGWYGDTIGAADYPYWDRLFEDPNFEQALTDRWQELRQTIFTTDDLLADVDAAVNLLSDGNPNLDRPAAGEPSNPISRNFTRWRSTVGSYLWPNCYFGVDDCPSTSPLEGPSNPSGRPQTYGDYIFLMRNFIEERMEWMDSQFLAPPTLATTGGPGQPVTLTMSAEQGTVVYSTDGSDPRDFIAGSRTDIFLPVESAVEVTVPTILDPFRSDLIAACTGATLASADACFMNPSYALGTHGESWTSGTMPIGFDDRDNFTAVINTDIGPIMDQFNPSAYVRIPFDMTAEQIESSAQLILQMQYDDGFVAYLWSDDLNLPVEIARAQAPGEARTVPINPLAFNAEATRSHNNSDAVVFEDFDVTDALQYLNEGQNYLLFQGLNNSPANRDFLLGAQISSKRKLTALPENVFAYSDPVTVDENARIVARAFDEQNDEWSGKTTTTVVVDPVSLAITELNYHPYEPTAQETAAGFTNPDEFEFIEVQNIGTNTPNLVGTSFTSGVEFEFPSVNLAPAQYGVIVSNLTAFQLRYGTEIPVIGQYAGNLRNAGEPVTIVNATGDVLASVAYGDTDLWPESADGFGATLQMVNPAGTTDERVGKYYSWQSSTEFGGSPGQAGDAPLGVVINEVLTNADAPAAPGDAIELYNTANSAANVGGWYVSDSINSPLKYRIPDNTTIGAGQYLVINESQFNPNPANPGPNDFALSGTRGDDVWLVVGNGSGGVASFADEIHFGAAASGETFGRVPNGAGLLAPMTTNTLGAQNSAPRVGPVVISEINYHPDEPTAADLAIYPELNRLDLEYVEVHNPTGQDVNLRDWQIVGGINHGFTSATTLGSKQTLVVIPFDPVDPANASRLAAFKSHYSVANNVAIVGGFQGQLSNSTERVQLLRPENAVDNVVPRIVEDEVIYDDLAPWPTGADGNGSSLSRAVATGWGGLASSWTAATPSPGTADVTGSVPGDSNGDGRFNQLDIVQVLQADKYLTGQPATLEEGDWNGDGFFNQLDIVYALQSGQYQPGAAAALRPGSTHRRSPIAERELSSDTGDSSAELTRSLRLAATQGATDMLFAKLGR